MTKVMSEQLRPLQKPHCDSDSSSSVTCCSLSCRILAITLPTTSTREMPLQLSHLLRSPFLGIGMRIASDQSLGTCMLLLPHSIYQIQQGSQEFLSAATSLHHLWEDARTTSCLTTLQLLHSTCKL